MNNIHLAAGGVCAFLLLFATALSIAAISLPEWGRIQLLAEEAFIVSGWAGPFQLCRTTVSEPQPCYEIHNYLESKALYTNSHSWLRGTAATIIICIFLNFTGFLCCFWLLVTYLEPKNVLLAATAVLAFFAGIFAAIACGLWTNAFDSAEYGSAMWLAVCTVIVDFIIFILALAMFVLLFWKERKKAHDTSYHTQHSGTYYVPPPTITRESQVIEMKNSASRKKVTRQASSVSKQSRVSATSSKHSNKYRQQHQQPIEEEYTLPRRQRDSGEFYLRPDELAIINGRLSPVSSIHSRQSHPVPRAQLWQNRPQTPSSIGYTHSMPRPNVKREDGLKVVWDPKDTPDIDTTNI